MTEKTEMADIEKKCEEMRENARENARPCGIGWIVVSGMSGRYRCYFVPVIVRCCIIYVIKIFSRK